MKIVTLMGIALLTLIWVSSGNMAGLVGALALTAYYFGKPVTFPIVLVVVILFAFPALTLLTSRTPSTCDTALLVLDQRAFGNFAVRMWAWWESSSFAYGLLYIAYADGLFIAINLAAFASPRPWRFLAKSYVASALGWLCFWLVPAQGPVFLLAGVTHAPRNCFPSMHVVWTLLIRREISKRGLTGRLAADAFVVLTCISTLGTGQHYTVDVLMAFPFWIAFEFVWNKIPQRQEKLGVSISESRPSAV
jgi:PAP2 superfamily protein